MRQKVVLIALIIVFQFAIPAQVILHSVYGGTNASAFGRTFDGGMTLGVSEVCTCSGGSLLQFQSYVDKTIHYYVYQLGVTVEYQNYNSFNSGGYFLDTHLPVGICLIYSGNSCTNSNSQPEGTLTKIGTS